MKALCYENTKTKLPNWDPKEKVHELQKYGYAYEINGYFIHFYGTSEGVNTISPGLTVIKKNTNNITLKDWIIETFGAINIKKSKYNIGQVYKGIWNPGLYYKNEIQNALLFSEKDNLSQRQSLYILMKEFLEILLYIEPDNNSLKAYSHKIRDLLILSCTEVENQFVSILKISSITPKKRNFDMNDYIIIANKSNIKSICVSFKNYDILQNINPFKSWNSKKPTQSLKWYDAYNKTKHNRTDNFKYSTLSNVINSIAANVILYCIRFGPYELFNSQDILSSYINQLVTINFSKDCHNKFYIPLLKLPDNTRDDIFVTDSYNNKLYDKWNSKNIYR